MPVWRADTRVDGAEFVVPYCIKVTLVTRQIFEAARGVQVQAISAICSFGIHLLHEGTVDLPDLIAWHIRLSIRRAAR